MALDVKVPLGLSYGAVGFINKIIKFVSGVARDERIPARDKWVALALLGLIISPYDLIPDWIPVIGLLDDVFYLALILDYFFNLLDDEILLGHYPWGMKSFVSIRRCARFIACLVPEFVRRAVWKYEPSPYRR